MTHDEEADSGAQTFSEKLLKSCPWWMLSFSIHGIAICLLFFIAAVIPEVEKPSGIITISYPRKEDEVKIIEKKPEVEIDIQETDILPIDDQADIIHDDPVIDPIDYEDITRERSKGSGTYGVIGPDFGAGGPGFGPRPGGKLKPPWRVPSKINDAVINALRWLARHQNPDGSWSATKHPSNCGKVKDLTGNCLPSLGSNDFDVGVTGLALLAFLGAGYTPFSNEVHDSINFSEVVKKGLKHLTEIQELSGRIGSDDASKYMYNHLIAAFALVEAYGMTHIPIVKDAAQKALNYTIQAQNPGKGFRYVYRSGDNDSSVTGWAAQLFKSAEFAKLEFPRAAYDGIISWYNEVTETQYYRVGYTNLSQAQDNIPTVIPGVNEHFDHHPALASIALMTRIFITRKKDQYVEGHAARLLEDLPQWDKEGKKVDFYYWYYATFSMFQYDGPDGSKWKKWNEALIKPLLEKQNSKKDECRHGSWEPADRWSSEGGRVYTTALGALTLEVYYRYWPVLLSEKYRR